jgi:hypoxanthine phosphoribosyltransferase
VWKWVSREGLERPTGWLVSAAFGAAAMMAIAGVLGLVGLLHEITLLIVMTGAVMPAAWLAAKLRMPLQMDFVHATRYAGQTEGGEIEFRVPPRLNLEGHDVLIVDDIYDIGLTLQMIETYCESRGARSVKSAVLVRKIHDRATTAKRPEFIGMEVQDKYIFGCGMDAYEHWRHLDEIRALEGV